MTPTTYDVFACPHHFQKPVFSMKVQTWLPQDQLDVSVNKGHLRCGFIDQALLLKPLGYYQPAQSILAIQVRRFKPSSVDITNGLSFASKDIEAYKIQIPT